VEHGAYADAEALQAMRENGVIWVPTLSTVGNLRGKGRFCEAAVGEILGCAMENVKYFANLGGLIAPGSDAGAWAVEHAMDSEWALLLRAIGPDAESVLAQGSQKIQEKF
jgi:hypothetical protein